MSDARRSNHKAIRPAVSICCLVVVIIIIFNLVIRCRCTGLLYLVSSLSLTFGLGRLSHANMYLGSFTFRLRIPGPLLRLGNQEGPSLTGLVKFTK